VRISVVKRLPERVPAHLPSVVLRRDNWDDYTFKTMYWAELWTSEGRRVELGSVKILRLGMQDGGRVDLQGTLDRLPVVFCSLGQGTSYYESLQMVGEPDASDFLKSMRDCAASTQIYQRFSGEEGFGTSLLRDGAARQALDLGRELFGGGSPELRRGDLVFAFNLPGSSEPLRFDFGHTQSLPSRVFAVTGYNGTGKTRLLAGLGWIAGSDDDQRELPKNRQSFGSFKDPAPDFGAVLCVSYSAFDAFPVPKRVVDNDASSEVSQPRHGIDDPTSADGTESISQLSRAYHYIGLRRFTPGGHVGSELKGIDEVAEEFETSRQQALSKLRHGQLSAILEPLLREPSFDLAGGLPDIDEPEEEWGAAIARLSTGHKVVLNVIVQLCAKLERRSLVLFDEPEMHLHPPLIAALLKSVQAALRIYDSFAVVATHSPVVVQELPSRHVMILRRFGKAAVIETPEIETFGEHVDLLTTRVFNLDNSASDFRSTLASLAVTRSLDEIEELFPLGLSAQGRVIVQSEIRRNDRER
jgi:predicted ATPase